jgi:hypothetical protein
VSKPRELIDSIFGKDKGIHLVNFFVSVDTISSIEGQLAEVTKNQSLLDLSHFIPSPFTDEDIRELCKTFGD